MHNNPTRTRHGLHEKILLLFGQLVCTPKFHRLLQTHSQIRARHSKRSRCSEYDFLLALYHRFFSSTVAAAAAAATKMMVFFVLKRCSMFVGSFFSCNRYPWCRCIAPPEHQSQDILCKSLCRLAHRDHRAILFIRVKKWAKKSIHRSAIEWVNERHRILRF